MRRIILASATATILTALGVTAFVARAESPTSAAPKTAPVSSASEYHQLTSTDCPTGHSSGMTPEYAGGTGDPSAEASFRGTETLIREEYGSNITSRVVISSADGVTKQYSDESGVIAEGSVVPYKERWRIEGLTQCAKHVAEDSDWQSASRHR